MCRRRKREYKRSKGDWGKGAGWGREGRRRDGNASTRGKAGSKAGGQTHDVLLEGVGVELLGLGVETGESVLGVGDEDTSVRGSLHGTEDSVSGRGSLETNVEEALEGSGSVLLVELLGEDESSIGLGDTLVLVGEVKLDEGSSSAEETGSVGGRPVGETVGDTVSGKLLGSGGSEDKVSLDWTTRGQGQLE